MNRHTLPLLAALAVLTLASLAHARFEWRNVRQIVSIHATGAITVTDTRTLWTDEHFGEAFLCITHGPDITLTLLDSSGAADDGPPMPARQQPCESGAPGTEVVVGDIDERVQERRVRFRYRLEGALDVHQDVVQWYWEIYGRGNTPPAIDYHLTVHAPGPMDAPYDAYVHRFSNPEEPLVRLSDDRTRLDVEFNRIPPGQGVEIRWLMPPRLFTVQGDARNMLKAYLEDEARLVQDARDAPPTDELPLDLQSLANRTPFERHVDTMFSNVGIVRVACPDLQAEGVRTLCGDANFGFSTFQERWDDAFNDPFDVTTPATPMTSWTLRDEMLVRVFHLQGHPDSPFYVAFVENDPYNRVAVFQPYEDTP